METPHIWTASDVILVIRSCYGPLAAFYGILIPIKVVRRIFSGF